MLPSECEAGVLYREKKNLSMWKNLFQAFYFLALIYCYCLCVPVVPDVPSLERSVSGRCWAAPEFLRRIGFRGRDASPVAFRRFEVPEASSYSCGITYGKVL